MGVFEQDAENVRDAIKRWAPRSERSEAAFENGLYGFLHGEFPEAVFQRQYARGKTRADMFVEFDDGAAVVVEVKKDLGDRGEYHRLIGQVYEYLTEWGAEVVVVLCGNNDPALVKLVKRAVDVLQEAIGKKAYCVERRCVQSASRV